MKLKYKNRLSATEKGQSLIEVLVAFTVSIIVGIALVSAGLATQRSSISARNKSQATKLAQEYLEQVRLIRDVKGYNTLFPAGFTNACYSVNTASGTDPSSWSLAYVAATCTSTQGESFPLNSTNFYRKVTISDVAGGLAKKVVVDVSWTEGTNARSVSEETTLSKWCDNTVAGANASPCP